MAFHAVFSKMQNRKYPFQFQRIHASSPLWPGRTAVYLIKGPDSDGPKIHVLFRDAFTVDPVDIRPDVGDQALQAMLIVRSPYRERQIGRDACQEGHYLFRRHAYSLRIPGGRGNLLIERIFIFFVERPVHRQMYRSFFMLLFHLPERRHDR